MAPGAGVALRQAVPHPAVPSLEMHTGGVSWRLEKPDSAEARHPEISCASPEPGMRDPAAGSVDQELNS